MSAERRELQLVDLRRKDRLQGGFEITLVLGSTKESNKRYVVHSFMDASTSLEKDPKYAETTLGIVLQWRERQTKFLMPWPLPKISKKWTTVFAILKTAQEKYADIQDPDIVEEKAGTIKKSEGWFWEQLMRLHSTGWVWSIIDSEYHLSALTHGFVDGNKWGSLIKDPQNTWMGDSLKNVLEIAWLDVQKKWAQE